MSGLYAPAFSSATDGTRLVIVSGSRPGVGRLTAMFNHTATQHSAKATALRDEAGAPAVAAVVSSR